MLDAAGVIREPRRPSDLRPVSRVRDVGEVVDGVGQHAERGSVSQPLQQRDDEVPEAEEDVRPCDYGHAHSARVRPGDQAPGAGEIGCAPRPVATGARRIREYVRWPWKFGGRNWHVACAARSPP